MQSSRTLACNNGVRPRCYTTSSGGSRRGTGVALTTDVVVSPWSRNRSLVVLRQLLTTAEQAGVALVMAGVALHRQRQAAGDD